MIVLESPRGTRVSVSHRRLLQVLERPEMRGMESAIGETISAPSVIVRDRRWGGVLLYHRFYERTAIGPRWLAVATKRRRREERLVTALLLEAPAGGRAVWKAAA